MTVSSKYGSSGFAVKCFHQEVHEVERVEDRGWKIEDGNSSCDLLSSILDAFVTFVVNKKD
jgi:hypothetical protein